MPNLSEGLRETIEYRRHHPMVPLLREDQVSSMVGWILNGKLTPTDDRPIHTKIREVRELKKYWLNKGLTYQRIVEVCVDYIFQNEKTLKTISEIAYKKNPWSSYVAAVLINGPLKKEKRDPSWKDDIIE